MTLNDLCQHLTKILNQNNAIRDPKRAARWIIADVCQTPLATQLTHPDQGVTQSHIDQATDWARRHAGGEPLSRIRGRAMFYDMEFTLSPDTLDPRPETELIVTAARDWIHSHKDKSSIRLLDLGTGTGCIPIAILKHTPHATATAIDISAGALETARKNAQTNQVADRLTFLQSDWYENLNHPQNLNHPPLPPHEKWGNHGFDIITSNPPYIPHDVIDTLGDEVRLYDPIRALDGGATGLDPYEILIAGLDTHLSPDGIALFEIGIGQAPDITRLVEKYGLDVAPPMVDDAGIPRVMCVTRPTKK